MMEAKDCVKTFKSWNWRIVNHEFPNFNALYAYHPSSITTDAEP